MSGNEEPAYGYTHITGRLFVDRMIWWNCKDQKEKAAIRKEWHDMYGNYPEDDHVQS